MNSVATLLNLNSELLDNFNLQARTVENNVEIERILTRAERRLKEIEARMDKQNTRPPFNKKSVSEVLEKLSKDLKAKKEDWSIRELRIVSYYLGSLHKNEAAFLYAVELLKSSWRDLYINGIVFFLMNSWNVCQPHLRSKICSLLKTQLAAYNGGIRKYILLKKHVDFFDLAGPMRLASLLATKKLSIESAPEILGMKPSALSFSYFSDTIIEYIRRGAIKDYADIENLLHRKHSLDRTRKLLCAGLIEEAERKGGNISQENVSRVANRLLGDINAPTTWAPFTGATPEEKNKLKRARDLARTWYARKSIEAFFNICVQDSRRRKFWLDYVHHIVDFRIVGSVSIRALLQSDATLSQAMKSCFIETNSRMSTTSALVLYVGNKVFVEFSDVGSLYIYSKSNSKIANLTKSRYVDSSSDLKSPGMTIAVEKINDWGGYYYYEEGRLPHIGRWEERLTGWMKNILKLIPGSRPVVVRPEVVKPKSTPLREPKSKSGDIFSWNVEYVSEPSVSGKTPRPTATTVKQGEKKCVLSSPIKCKLNGILSKRLRFRCNPNSEYRVMLHKGNLYLYDCKCGYAYKLRSIPPGFEGCFLSMWIIEKERPNYRLRIRVMFNSKYTRYNKTEKFWEAGELVNQEESIFFECEQSTRIEIKP